MECMRVFNSICFATILLIACSGETKFEVRDAGKDEEFRFTSNSKYITTLKFIVKGEVDDTAKINNLLIVPTSVDTIFQTDWYNKDVLLSYKSYKATTGKLDISVLLP